jgi:hypothetical protein
MGIDVADDSRFELPCAFAQFAQQKTLSSRLATVDHSVISTPQ